MNTEPKPVAPKPVAPELPPPPVVTPQEPVPESVPVFDPPADPVLPSDGSNNPVSIAYKTEGVAVRSVDAAMRSWAEWVQGGHATQKQVDTVKKAYGVYYDTQTTLKTAVDSYAADPTAANKSAIVVAASGSTASGVALVSLIAQTQGKK